MVLVESVCASDYVTTEACRLTVLNILFVITLARKAW